MYLPVDGHKIIIEPLKMSTAKDKIIWFCLAFKHYRKTNYLAKEHEKANIKNVPVSRDLLDVFFKSPINNFTIDNYISRINITKDHSINGLPSEQRFPNHYDSKFERTLSGQETMKYHQHLKAKDWVKQEVPGQGVVWKEGK